MNSLKANQIYRHFKGDLYQVVDIAKNAETQEEYVVYRALYGTGDLWVTSAARFLSEVDHRKYPEISQKYRFALQEIKSVAVNYDYTKTDGLDAIDYENPTVLGFCDSASPYYNLSNEAPSVFTYQGITYQSMEQYLMYQKASLCKDFDIANQILKETDPEQMRILGRQVKNYDHRWDNPQEILLKGLKEKFLQNPVLCKELLDTGNTILAECSRTDHKWGIGLILSDPRVSSPEKWRGRNLLGYSLMQVRSDIMKMKSGIPDEQIKKQRMPKIFVLTEDITEIKTDALLCPGHVKYAKASEIEEKIMSAAGPTLFLECQTRGNLQAGDAFITRGYQLPVDYVVHTVIPEWVDGKSKEAATLTIGLRKCLSIAAANGIHTLSIPSISEGDHKYPVKEVAKVIMRTLVEYLRNNPDANLSVTIAAKDNIEKYQYERALSHFTGRMMTEKKINREIIDYNANNVEINFNDVVFLATGVTDATNNSNVITVIENRAYEINIYKMTRATLLQMLPNEYFRDFMALLNHIKNPGKPIVDGWVAEILGIGYSLYMRDYVSASFQHAKKERSAQGNLKDIYQDLAITVLSKI